MLVIKELTTLARWLKHPTVDMMRMEMAALKAVYTYCASSFTALTGKSVRDEKEVGAPGAADLATI